MTIGLKWKNDGYYTWTDGKPLSYTEWFRCNDGQVISISGFCDFMRDCVDGSDENSCYHPPCLSTQYRCSNHQCIDSYKRCDGLANCKDGSDEIGCTGELCQGFSCADGECISSQLYRDGVVDCSGSLEEDELVTNMTVNPEVYCNNENNCTTRFTDLCKESGEQRCSFNSPRCYSRHERCILERMPIGFPVCRNLEHILACNDFECAAGTVKCPASYCIPIRHVCDGRSDCPNSEDERNCETWSCPGMFKCGQENRCIPQSEVCDGVVNCKHNSDDETYLNNLYTLDLTHNRLTSLSANTFAGLIGLKQLFLIGNPLQHLEDGSFRDLVNNYEVISVQRNVLGDLTSLKYLASDAYKFCCMAPNVDRCLPEADQFSTCSDLMGNAVLRAIIWMIASFSFLANSIVILFRVQALRMESSGTRNTSSDILIINIAGCDFLMSVYLFLIAGADHVFKGVYYLNSETWTDSSLCRLARVIVAVSCEGSLTFLLILTRQRYSNIVNPFSRSPIITPKYVIGFCCICWLVISTVSILPLSSSSYFGDNFYGTTGVCLPMNLLTIDVNGWHYSFAIFALFNAAILATIMTTYAQMYRLVSGSRSGSGRADPTELVLARRSLVINLCNLFCWLPIIIVQFCAVFSVEIPNQVAAWLAVLFLPINSSLNPLLYTILNIDIKSIRERNKRRLGLTTSSK
ncbi:uncharacterized protein LOC141911221 [Tubulanus polymorphus]|uniref:uncharacterized protein LOC141911221 n=1 Tax=Tubulanus polymorphus TaxID=672921 RepID=UPI003DA5EA93